VLNGIRYTARSAGPVASCGTFQNAALMPKPKAAGREASPTGGILNSEMKARVTKERGFVAEKMITGRERHVTLDTNGRLLTVILTAADVLDRAGAQASLPGRRQHPLIAFTRSNRIYKK
jgi:hypothetical protein